MRLYTLLSGFCLLFLYGTVNCCNPDWYPYNQKCYRNVKFTYDIRMARRYCQIYGGDLATINDRETIQALVSVLAESREAYWLNEKSAINQTTSSTYCSFLYFDENTQQLEIGVDGECSEGKFFICEVFDDEGQIGCPKSWSLYGGTCYKAMKTKSTYDQAVSFCSVQRANLSVLDDIGKEHNAAAVIIGTTEPYLVAAKVENENGVIKWSTGSNFQPSCSECRNNTPGECIGFASDPEHPTIFTWVNLNCNAPNNFLCEMPPVALSTTPTTTQPTTTQQPLQCPVGYNWKAHEESGFCYWETTYETDRLNWFQARQFCQGYGGDLATYDNKDQEDHGLGGAKGHYRGLWFGLKRDENDVMRWVDGTTPNYTNWKTDEPNLNSRSKYCVVHGASYSRWELDYCGVKRWFICKAPKQKEPKRVDLNMFKKINCNFTGPSVYSSRWYLYGDHCYMVHEVFRYTWNTAQYFCQDNGGHLASIHSFDETNFILQVLSTNPNSDLWIGLSARGLDASLTWSDGTPLDFLYWDDNFNDSQIVDSCIVFDKQRGSWTISHCNKFYGVICKRGFNSSYEFTTPEPTPTLPGNCQPGWYRLGNKCYWVDGKRYSQRSTWNEAVQKCKEKDATLASIHSAEEQELLTDILLETRSSSWVGLEYNRKNSVFEWQDGTPLDYTNWNTNEPTIGRSDSLMDSGTSQSTLICVELETAMTEIGEWNDVSCHEHKSFICQKNVDPTIKESPPDPFLCPNISGWRKLGSSCYGVFAQESDKLPWLEAQIKCRTYGANLIIFKSEAVAIFIKRKLQTKDEFYWIGRRETKINTYERVVKSDYAYSNWLADQPKRVSDRENCVAMNSDSKWVVMKCLERHPFVCELNNEPEKDFSDDIIEDTKNCPSGSNWHDLGGDNCYFFDPTPHTWSLAVTACIKQGAHLATFHSMEELDRVKTFTSQKTTVFGRSFHIGLGRRFDGSYTWVDHSPLDFVYWQESPEMYSESCVQMDYLTGRWKPTDCSVRMRPYLCSLSKNKGIKEETKQNKTSQQKLKEEPVVVHKISAGGIIGIITIVAIVLAIIGGLLYRKYQPMTVKPSLLEPEGL